MLQVEERHSSRPRDGRDRAKDSHPDVGTTGRCAQADQHKQSCIRSTIKRLLTMTVEWQCKMMMILSTFCAAAVSVKALSYSSTFNGLYTATPS